MPPKNTLPKNKQKQSKWKCLGKQSRWNTRVKNEHLTSLNSLFVLDNEGGGNCFFHAVADALNHSGAINVQSHDEKFRQEDIRSELADGVLTMGKRNPKTLLDLIEQYEADRVQSKMLNELSDSNSDDDLESDHLNVGLKKKHTSKKSILQKTKGKKGENKKTPIEFLSDSDIESGSENERKTIPGLTRKTAVNTKSKTKAVEREPRLQKKQNRVYSDNYESDNEIKESTLLVNDEAKQNAGNTEHSNYSGLFTSSSWNPSKLKEMAQRKKSSKSKSSKPEYDFIKLAEHFATVVRRHGFCYQGDETVLYILTHYSKLFTERPLGIIILKQNENIRAKKGTRVKSAHLFCSLYQKSTDTTTKAKEFICLLHRQSERNGDHWMVIGYQPPTSKKKQDSKNSDNREPKMQTVFERKHLPPVFHDLLKVDCPSESDIRLELENHKN